MSIPRFLSALLGILLTTPLWAQSAGKPLNLKLPPGHLPAASGTAATPPRDAPGVYYGDTSGRTSRTDLASDVRLDCDDSTYNTPQIHGRVGMGVVSGHHLGGHYQSGSVNLTQAFGSCDDPAGGISISVGRSHGDFHGRGH